MSLSIPGMAAAIEAQLLAAAPMALPSQFALALATAIVDYMKSNTVVVPTALVAPGGGGPVTGTGTIT